MMPTVQIRNVLLTSHIDLATAFTYFVMEIPHRWKKKIETSSKIHKISRGVFYPSYLKYISGLSRYGEPELS
jgi:hypothetical protein